MIRLEFDGADELIADMQKLVSDYPKEASDALFEVAENFNEDVNAKMPGSYGNKIRKWKIAGAKEGISSFVTSTNRAPQNTIFTGIIQAALFQDGIMQSGRVKSTRRNIQSLYPGKLKKC